MFSFQMAIIIKILSLQLSTKYHSARQEFSIYLWPTPSMASLSFCPYFTPGLLFALTTDCQKAKCIIYVLCHKAKG